MRPLARRFLGEPRAGLLHRVIILLALLGHLSYGLNASADAHWTDAESHHHVSFTADDSDTGADVDADCDHGCHAASHLLGMLQRQTIYLGNGGDEPRFTTTDRFHSYSFPPPKRPPKRLA